MVTLLWTLSLFTSCSFPVPGKKGWGVCVCGGGGGRCRQWWWKESLTKQRKCCQFWLGINGLWGEGKKTDTQENKFSKQVNKQKTKTCQHSNETGLYETRPNWTHRFIQSLRVLKAWSRGACNVCWFVVRTERVKQGWFCKLYFPPSPWSLPSHCKLFPVWSSATITNNGQLQLTNPTVLSTSASVPHSRHWLAVLQECLQEGGWAGSCCLEDLHWLGMSQHIDTSKNTKPTLKCF